LLKWCICNNLGYIYIPSSYKDRNNSDCLWYAVKCPGCQICYPLTVDELIECIYLWKRDNLLPKKIKVTSDYLAYLSRQIHFSNDSDKSNAFYGIPIVVDESVDFIEIDMDS
jgi:hypothetical protein